MIRSRSETADQDGFTIPELLVAVAVGAIASLLITSAFVFTYGSAIVEQTRTSMTRNSQVFLRKMVEDIRVSNEIRTSNLLQETDGSTGTWITSDPANILIATSPATDSNKDLIFNTDSGDPYQNEIVYFSDGGRMYRRTLRNSAATTSAQTTTCPSGTVGCPADIDLVGDVENMLFEFYDNSNAVTSVPEEAKSVQITINLSKKVYGQVIKTTNTTRITLRNEK